MESGGKRFLPLFFENIYKKIKKKSLEELENYTKNERMWGDIIALFMSNRWEFVTYCELLSKLGNYCIKRCYMLKNVEKCSKFK